MTAADVIEHALRVYYADSAEPNRIVSELLDRFAVEAVAAAAPPPLDAAREQELRAELVDGVYVALAGCPEFGYPGLAFTQMRNNIARHVADRLFPQVLGAERFIASYAANLADQETKRVALETERDALRDVKSDLEDRLTARIVDDAARPSRAEVLAEVVAWLSKKAVEHRARGPQYGKQADLIAELADKVRRGAVRPNNLRSLDEAGEPSPPDPALAPAAAVQFATARPDGSVLDDVPATDRADAEARLARTRHQYPTARLVQRTVRYGPWTDATEAGDDRA